MLLSNMVGNISCDSESAIASYSNVMTKMTCATFVLSLHVPETTVSHCWSPLAGSQVMISRQLHSVREWAICTVVRMVSSMQVQV